jgi:hypothetical protein
MFDENKIYFNGVNGTTGDYLTGPLLPRELAGLLLSQGTGLERGTDLGRAIARRYDRDTTGEVALAPQIDARDLSQTGWGVIFARDADPEVVQALQPLVEHRRSQASRRKERYYRALTGGDGVQPGETKTQFLHRHGVLEGVPVEPRHFPYYLLLVGDPEAIPYRFQYELDVEYAVGRLHFQSIEEYTRYAHSVVEAETTPPGRPQQAVFFGPQHRDDLATYLSVTQLIEPLVMELQEEQPEWSCTTVLGDQATKARLADLVGGSATPAFLFTASHGVGFSMQDGRQRHHQGALLCQDWEGIYDHRERLPESTYFSADDVEAAADLLGLITFHFACYGAGTPKDDDFSHIWKRDRTTRSIARSSFVAALPQRLLSHPGKGALAAVSHVGRAWTHSFLLGALHSQTQTFKAFLTLLINGYPVGAAMEPFNQRYAALATSLTGYLDRMPGGASLDNDVAVHLASLWMAHNDARNYAVVGDPAVRLSVRAERP